MEGFWFLPQTKFPSYCKDCGYKNKWQCKNCLNCGWILTQNGYGECVPGDEYGPLFNSDYIAYDYGRSFNPYYNLQNIYTPPTQPIYKPWWAFSFPRFWKKRKFNKRKEHFC